MVFSIRAVTGFVRRFESVGHARGGLPQCIVRARSAVLREQSAKGATRLERVGTWLPRKTRRHARGGFAHRGVLLAVATDHGAAHALSAATVAESYVLPAPQIVRRGRECAQARGGFRFRVHEIPIEAR
jgi:hypothetical protein